MRVGMLLFVVLSLRAQDTQLEHARQVNLDRAANLPNFFADEIAVRYKSPHSNQPKWQMVDTIESEIAVRGDGFTRQRTTVNGKPWNKPNLPNGVGWSVRFGYEIKPLFGEDCHTKIEPAGSEERLGKPALAYRFRAGQDGCFGAFATNEMFRPRKVYKPAQFGRFLIDEATGNLIYFEIEANEFPKGFGVASWREIESWESVKIADASYLLPVSTEIFIDYTEGGRWHVTVGYRNHRHFEASTDITFK